MTKERKIPIMELFGPTVQGEGLMTGTITHFLRTGGCGLRCRWCDTMFAVDPKLIRAHRQMMTTNEILGSIQSLPYAPYITFTGGDPCLHETLGDIIPTLNVNGMRVAVETQGQLFPEWLKTVDVITFSPKPPSSRNIVDPSLIKDYLLETFPKRPVPRVCIKVVVFDEQDFEYAMAVYGIIPQTHYDAFYFTAGTPMPADVSPEEKVNLILQNLNALSTQVIDHTGITSFNEKVHVGCQQHALTWPDKNKGV